MAGNLSWRAASIFTMGLNVFDHFDWFWQPLPLSDLDSSRVSALKIYQNVCVCVCWDRQFETQGKVMKRAKSAPGPPAQWPSMRPMPPTSFTGYWEMKDSDNSRTLPVDLFCNVLQLATYEKDRETYQTLHPYDVWNVVGLHTISSVVDFRIPHTLDRTYWYVEELCIKIQYASAVDNFKEI